MKIATDSIELEFYAEDMRHFKIDDAKKLRRFIDIVRIEKRPEAGFKTDSSNPKPGKKDG